MRAIGAVATVMLNHIARGKVRSVAVAATLSNNEPPLFHHNARPAIDRTLIPTGSPIQKDRAAIDASWTATIQAARAIAGCTIRQTARSAANALQRALAPSQIPGKVNQSHISPNGSGLDSNQEFTALTTDLG